MDSFFTKVGIRNDDGTSITIMRDAYSAAENEADQDDSNSTGEIPAEGHSSDTRPYWVWIWVLVGVFVICAFTAFFCWLRRRSRRLLHELVLRGALLDHGLVGPTRQQGTRNPGGPGDRFGDNYMYNIYKKIINPFYQKIGIRSI